MDGRKSKKGLIAQTNYIYAGFVFGICIAVPSAGAHDALIDQTARREAS
jgi:hypothetical protein